ncbi:MAG TPA: hypothetical protein VFG29_03100 [Syntrophales bacterium]|nr:hypothetical protein [Syntrophales bacterium]
MKRPLRVMIVGGVACRPKAASRLKRLLPEKTTTGDCMEISISSRWRL